MVGFVLHAHQACPSAYTDNPTSGQNPAFEVAWNRFQALFFSKIDIGRVVAN
jgi:hypothetical protein